MSTLFCSKVKNLLIKETKLTENEESQCEPTLAAFRKARDNLSFSTGVSPDAISKAKVFSLH